MKSISAEQNAIVESKSSCLRVDARAGSGKTSTLVCYAAARPREKIVYIAFNKSIQLEAKRKFGNNVECVTPHGMAFAKFGFRYLQNNKLVDKIRINQVIDALDLREYPAAFGMYIADASLKLVNRYLYGNAIEITEQLTAGLIVKDAGASASDIVFCAQRLWSKMQDPSDASVGMVHDGYLKMYQLSGPQLRYDRILFDEAQDSNGVTAALVDAQSCEKVIVGDNHQAIYSFRGAVNAMNMFKTTETLYLTKSFRFGQPIADVANTLLGNYKGETRLIKGTDEPAAIGAIDTSKPYAVISRSNATLFDEAISLMAQGKRLHFVGGIQGYRMGDLLDTYNLYSGQTDRIQSGHMKAFNNFQAAEDFSVLSDDKELKSLINMVKRHGSRLPSLVSRLKKADVEDGTLANVALTTAHKSKGLEWDQVKLTDDYMTLFDTYKKPRKIEFSEEEDVNILYVAATRARRNLQPFPELKELLDHKKAQIQAAARATKMPEWARPLPAGSVTRR